MILASNLDILSHHVVVHNSLGAEEREAARAAEDAAEDVLCGLLQPVAHRVLELLVPDVVVAFAGTYNRRYNRKSIILNFCYSTYQAM